METSELHLIEKSFARPELITTIMPEFTSLCPVTGYPDFAEIRIEMIPKNRVVELKSLKLYLNAFRNVGIHHEDVIQKIFQDIFLLTSPRFLRISGNFNPRGNVLTFIELQDGEDELYRILNKSIKNYPGRMSYE